MSESRRPAEPEYEVEELDLSGEELDTQVQRAQEQLVELRRRQEQIEKEKQRLEELSRRQEDLEVGRTEIAEKLTRALTSIQREAGECQKRTEQLLSIEESFSQHLKTLQALNPRAWAGPELPHELARGIEEVEEARSEYNKLSPKISEEVEDPVLAGTGTDYEDFYGAEKGFGYWFVSGLAFTLPLVILGLIALAIWVWQTILV